MKNLEVPLQKFKITFFSELHKMNVVFIEIEAFSEIQAVTKAQCMMAIPSQWKHIKNEDD